MLNLIDELHANENAHSRILFKLFQAKDKDDNYYILNSFLIFLSNSFSKLADEKVKKITCEEDRIDLRVNWNNNTLIIENKIHNAQEQEKQINRYIVKENKKYDIKNIYVLNLGRHGDEEPSGYSFSDEIKKKIGKNYNLIGFKSTILPWLEFHVLPNCKVKDTYLISTVEQYIDHLKEMFHLRKIDKNMNEEIKKYLENKFDIENKSNEIQLEVINKKENDVNEILEYIVKLRVEKEREINRVLTRNWILNINNKMKEDYEKYNPVYGTMYDDGAFELSYIKLNIMNYPVRITIGKAIDKTDLCYGICTVDLNEKYDKVLEIIDNDIKNKITKGEFEDVKEEAILLSLKEVLN